MTAYAVAYLIGAGIVGFAALYAAGAPKDASETAIAVVLAFLAAAMWPLVIAAMLGEAMERCWVKDQPAEKEGKDGAK